MVAFALNTHSTSATVGLISCFKWVRFIALPSPAASDQILSGLNPPLARSLSHTAPNTSSSIAGRMATIRNDAVEACTSTLFSASPVKDLKASSPPAAVVFLGSKIDPILRHTKYMEQQTAKTINPTN